MSTKLCPKRFCCLFRTQQITLKWLLAPLRVKGILYGNLFLLLLNIYWVLVVWERKPLTPSMCSARNRTYKALSVLSATSWLLSDHCQIARNAGCFGLPDLCETLIDLNIPLEQVLCRSVLSQNYFIHVLCFMIVYQLLLQNTLSCPSGRLLVFLF